MAKISIVEKMYEVKSGNGKTWPTFFLLKEVSDVLSETDPPILVLIHVL